MGETVTISKEEYVELQLFKKLVENKLSDELTDEELKAVENVRKEKSMTKEEFLKKSKKLIGTQRNQVSGDWHERGT